MISTFDNCLFVHIPKTAGQSVESVFLARAGLTWEQREEFLLMKNSDPQKGPPRLAHLTAQEYLDYGYITQQNFSRFYKFTVVRNPWERLVSEYNYQQYPCSFRDFVLNFFPVKGQDDYINHRGQYRHVMPQSQFVCDHQGKLMLDSVIKFESLPQDFAKVSKKITGKELRLPHKNKTTEKTLLGKIKQQVKGKLGRNEDKQHYSEFYDTQTQQWVEDYYADDIRLFNYSFLR